jgi:hypothetical protein
MSLSDPVSASSTEPTDAELRAIAHKAIVAANEDWLNGADDIAAEIVVYRALFAAGVASRVVPANPDTEEVPKRFSSNGMTHRVDMFPSEPSHTGKGVWLLTVASMGGSGSAYITEGEGFKLAAMLLAGIPEKYTVKGFDIGELL